MSFFIRRFPRLSVYLLGVGAYGVHTAEQTGEEYRQQYWEILKNQPDQCRQQGHVRIPRRASPSQPHAGVFKAVTEEEAIWYGRLNETEHCLYHALFWPIAVPVDLFHAMKGAIFQKLKEGGLPDAETVRQHEAIVPIEESLPLPCLSELESLEESKKSSEEEGFTNVSSETSTEITE